MSYCTLHHSYERVILQLEVFYNEKNDMFVQFTFQKHLAWYDILS